MTKINRLFLFIFACVPGAGQMYLGYMKRGLCLISAFCMNIFVAAVISQYLTILLAIVWMYSFFDTYDLRRKMLSGDFPEDDYMFKFLADESICRLIRIRSRFVGWILVGLGALALYDNVIMSTLHQLYDRYDWIAPVIQVCRQLPDLVVAAVLILVGIWLVRGKNESSDDIPTYGEDR